MLSEIQKKQLLSFARDVIAAHLNSSDSPSLPANEYREKCGVFVTLHKAGELRGCIGYIKGYKSIADSIREMSLAAAFQDPRFPPVTVNELAQLKIEISLLSPLQLVQETGDIEIGRDGLYLEHPRSSGLLLPQVATEWNWDRETFLKQICRKASLPPGAHQDAGAKLYRFNAEIFSE